MISFLNPMGNGLRSLQGLLGKLLVQRNSKLRIANEFLLVLIF